MSHDNFTRDHFLKIKWLFAEITVIGSPDRGERDIFGMILLSGFWPIQATFVVGEAFCDVGLPS